MKRLLFIVCFINSITPVTAQVTGEPENIIIGSKLIFHSDILDMDAELAIYLPPGYDETKQQYPVLYILRDYFHIATAAVSDLAKLGQIPEMIVVDFQNNPMNEVPTTLPNRESMTGGAPQLITFFKDELHPYIDSAYRTQPYRIIFSGSWGGVFCVYSALTEPDLFHASIASGPWIIYDGEEEFILRNTKNFLHTNNYKSNYLFVSGGNQPELTPALEEFFDLLDDNAPEGLRWQYDPMPDDDHGTIQYKTIFDGLRNLYIPWHTIPDAIIDAGIQSLREYGNTVEDIFGYDIKISPFALAVIGQNFTVDRKYSDSIELFQYYREVYPDDHYAPYMIGRNYESMEDYAESIKYFEQAIAIRESSNVSGFTWYDTHLKNAKEKLSQP
jgi:predicted alpha/beta superfamily hydrolase